MALSEKQKSGWVTVYQASNYPPSGVGEEQFVEAMLGDGSTVIQLASLLAWSYSQPEEKRVTQYRYTTRFAAMGADELLGFIARSKQNITELEIALKTAKQEHQVALNDLNRRLQDNCGVSLNEVMKPSGMQPR